MSGSQDSPFELTGPLPAGRVAIEASAGTGKTFTLAALATRYIAERGVPSSELLMVTFTRAATEELRARVRQQLALAASVLAGDSDAPEHDVLLGHLLAADDDVRARRLERLRRAVSEFDAATIITIHGFATQVRSTLGLSVAVDPDARLLGTMDDLIRQACSDVLAAAAVHDGTADLLPSLPSLIQSTGVVVGRPGLVVEPHSVDQGASADLLRLRRLVMESVDGVARRKEQAGVLGFDDVLTQLSATLEGDGGAAVVSALRSRFTVALVDEFQDTDPVQWTIFSTLFGEPGSETTLVLVGDPKQAIYRFRGADIDTYLDAVGDGSGTVRHTLTTNWRSDGAVLSSLHALFDGATFGAEAIRYRPVHPAPGHRDRRLRTLAGDPLPALALRLAVGPTIEHYESRGRPSAQVRTGPAAAAIERDLVAHLRTLFASAVLPPDPDGTRARPVRPSDVAVLVSSGNQGRDIQAALLRQGVPAVVATDGTVLESAAAGQVRLLLAAMERPAATGAVRALALSWFVGWTADRVAEATEEELTPLQEQVADWVGWLSDHAVADVLARIWSETGVVARVLGRPDGDRNLTDLDHLAELLHGSAPDGRSGVAGLLAVLDEPPEADADTEADGSVVARRIESEADAVQIMTIWKAKGLEFPVVCVPGLWRSNTMAQPVITVDPSTGRRTFDLAKGTGWPDKRAAAARKADADADRYGEQLRILYVALTRAQHQTVVWWGNTSGSAKTALAHLLFARADGVIDQDAYLAPSVDIPTDETIGEVLAAMADRAEEGVIAVQPIADLPAPSGRWSDPGAAPDRGSLGLARFDTVLDRSFQRWSFSSMTDQGAAAHPDPYDASLSDRAAGDEPDAAGDEPGAAGNDTAEREQAGPDLPATAAGPAGTADPGAVGPGVGLLAPLPAGTAFGTLVHAVLEEVDFASDRLEDELDSALDRQLQRTALDLTPAPGGPRDTPTDPAPAQAGLDGRHLLVAGLRAALDTPLGSRLGGVRLSDIARKDRLVELSFDLRLGEQGHHPTGRDIGQLVSAHLGTEDPLRFWAEGVAAGSIDVELAGTLTGSIDLVLRLSNGSGPTRFVVADYKSNLLTPRGHHPRPDDYHPDRLAEAMAEHHYPLQALLYSVALHRYLRWRLEGYRPELHLGGAVYLFVRGMAGPGGATVGGGAHGVFDWAVPPDLVVELSDLLAGRPATTAAGGVGR